MKLTVTSIRLKSPWHFFALSAIALKILKQLKETDCVAFKKKGFWLSHYTMTLWKTEADLREFATSDAHLSAMKQGGKIASEIRTLTLDADQLVSWDEAKKLLANSKVITY